MNERIKTVFLLTLLTVLLVWLGGIFGGTAGMLIALLFAGGMNFYAYYYSDKMVLKHYNAVEVDSQSAPGLYAMVQQLVHKANLPMPKVYIVPDSVPNAFATGRNPQNAAVAVTEGLLELLNEEEIEGVIAHELSHVRHYDILVGTIAATIAGAIAVIANIMQFAAMFGGRGNNSPHPIVMIGLAIILPLAATVIQMSVSRSREYMADAGAAQITGKPQHLQSALLKLENYAKRATMQKAQQQNAHMFIINPFSGKKAQFASLFQTHPSTQDRVARLEELKATYNPNA
ncbi:MAG: zinc metalloprotease HtpX, partial [Campylobacterota bacterium]